MRNFIMGWGNGKLQLVGFFFFFFHHFFVCTSNLVPHGGAVPVPVRTRLELVGVA